MLNSFAEKDNSRLMSFATSATSKISDLLAGVAEHLAQQQLGARVGHVACRHSE